MSYIKNRLLHDENEYVQTLYIKTLCTIIQHNGNGTDEQEMFLSRVINGSCGNKDISFYMKKAFIMNKMDFEEIANCLMDKELKYYFVLDAIIVAALSENRDEAYSYCQELFAIIEISIDELKYLASIAKMALLQDIKSFYQWIDCIPDKFLKIDFGIYFEELKDHEEIVIMIRKAEVLFEWYEVEKLMPILKELVQIGIPKAMHMLALIYEDGAANIKRDDSKAMQLYKNAADLGYLPSIARKILPRWGKIDLKMAKNLYSCLLPELKKRADIGEKFAAEEIARVLLNVNFLKENDVDITVINMEQQDAYLLAIEYFKMAPMVLGLYGIANRYKNGDGVEKNLNKAFEYYISSAIYGYPNAEYEIGLAFQYGNGVEINKKKAYEFYVKAYNHGSYNAINKYGWCLSSEFGTTNDYDLAFKLFNEGAMLGLSTPTYNVGLCYQYGDGVEKDMNKAKEYYLKALELGSEWAQEQLDKYF